MGLLDNIGSAAATGGVGLGMTAIGNLMQTGQQQKLTDMQVKAQQQMTDYNTRAQYDSQLKMWNATNAEAQVQHYKNAGLNPALMYEGSGAGGATVGGGASTGSVSGGSAASGTQNAEAGMAMMTTQASVAMMKAQASKAEADANLANVQANKLSGADTGKVIADTNLTNTNNELAKVQLEIQKAAKSGSINTILATGDKLEAEARSAAQTAHVDESTTADKISQIRANVASTVIQQEAMKAGIEVDKERVNEIINNIQQGWAEIQQHIQDRDYQYKSLQQNIDVQLQKLGIDKEMMSSEKFKNYTGGISNIIGNILSGAKGLKGKPQTETRQPIGFNKNY